MPELGQTELHWLWKETNNKLDSFTQRVRECACLESAHEFCSYLQWSGILRLFTANPQDFPLKVDGPLLEHKVNELLFDIRKHYITGKMQPTIELSELQRVNHKLDLIAGQLARVVPVPQVDISAPPLRIIEGGKNG